MSDTPDIVVEANRQLSNTDYDQLQLTDRSRCLCAEYQAVVVDRLTFQPIVRLPKYATDGTWNRNLNQSSEATAVVHIDSPLGGNCCDKLSKIGEWGHELVITRQGDQLPCWMGPIVSLVEDPLNATFSIRALDRSTWFSGMPIGRTINIPDTAAMDAAQYFKLIYSYGFEIFNPGLQLQVTNSGVKVAKVLNAADGATIDDELTSLANDSIDWTVINTTMLVGGLQVPAPYIQLRTSMWIDPPVLTEDARLFVTDVSCGGDQISGRYPSDAGYHPDPFYGVHAHRITDDKLKTVAECVAAAKAYYDLYHPVARYMTTNDSSLGPSSTVLPPQLIPGTTALIALDQGCLQSSQTVQMMLAAVAVEWTAGKETAVKPDFQPLGQIDVVVGGFQ